ncbi:MAG: bifunctional phosphopantothenoylcysteine decarboxylase/phosphopantothenate--cysteine ligase CoaBC [Lachnospiraceae bacterium]|nr:bifunctional phosphopantothenoylcysteine decarboxylase/phosphopantothenate--cysteine ligase CoaBC [Lachnospiraceae bacterium]
MKNILLVVTGSIAAYKAADLAHMLKKAGFCVNVLMTENGARFISPMTFESLTGNKCVTDTFDRNFEFKIGHISLAKSSDLCIIAPASANVIGKLANGIADDMVTTTVMACTCTTLIAPAMNTAMYRNPIVQDNLSKLRHFGYRVIEPAKGELACGDVGEGKLPPVQELFDEIMLEIGHEHDMTCKNVLITAGPTAEALDPVRYITNHSTGKMGYALARAAAERGASVTLISGRTALTPPKGVDYMPVFSAAEMAEAVKSRAERQDILIFAAAVADYRPKRVAEEKIKKSDAAPTLELERTEDILDYVGHHRHGNEFVCGFAMETQNLLENARGKLERKNADMICANSLRAEGAGFGTDTNRISLITSDGVEELELMSKDQVSHRILDEIMGRMEKGEG